MQQTTRTYKEVFQRDMGYTSICLYTTECFFSAALSMDLMCLTYLLYGIFGIHTSIKYSRGHGALDMFFISHLFLLEWCGCDSCHWTRRLLHLQ